MALFLPLLAFNIKHPKQKNLILRFNKDFLLQIENSSFYKRIKFQDLIKFKRPITTRVYEILSKSFQKRSVWKIDSVKLAQKIPISQKFPSHIVRAIIPTVNRIQKKTDLNVHLELDKKKRGCIILIFKLKNNPKLKALPPSQKAKDLPENSLSILTLIPSNKVKSIKDFVLKTCKEKGTEYVKKAIEYTNSKNPDNYPAYLRTALDQGYDNSSKNEENPIILSSKIKVLCLKLQDITNEINPKFNAIENTKTKFSTEKISEQQIINLLDRLIAKLKTDTTCDPFDYSNKLFHSIVNH